MRGILGVVLSACLIVGCGGGVGVEDAQGEQDAPAETPAVTTSALTYCYIMEARECRAQGTKILCTPDGIGTATCYCQSGWWDCPPYENGPIGE